jgi:hypothetical protein
LKNSFLRLAVEFGLLYYFEAQLERGVPVEPGPECWSLLDWATLRHTRLVSFELQPLRNSINVDLIKLLLDRGADPNRANLPGGSIPSKILVERAKNEPKRFDNWTEVMELYILHGADRKVDLSNVPGAEQLKNYAPKEKDKRKKLTWYWLRSIEKRNDECRKGKNHLALYYYFLLFLVCKVDPS